MLLVYKVQIHLVYLFPNSSPTRYLQNKMPKVLITGGSGLVGIALSEMLSEKGYAVSWLSTQKKTKTLYPAYYWNVEKNEIDSNALNGVDYIIHLAGVNVSEKRWSKEQKQRIIRSRVAGANLLFEKVTEMEVKPKAFISASGINYYGTITSNLIFSESDSCGSDFLADVCRQWEDAAFLFSGLGIRTVVLRTGIVLSANGGALHKMLTPVKWGVGSPLGGGKQYMPWIHLKDLCNMYIKAIEDNNMQGAYNAVAPQHITNAEFLKRLAKVLKAPYFMPAIPAVLLRVLLGEMSSIILQGSRASCKKIQDAGYRFIYYDIDEAFYNCCSVVEC